MMRLTLHILALLFAVQVYSQHQNKVDFIRASIIVTPNFPERTIEGFVTYEFNILEKVDSIFLDAKHMHFSKVRLDDKKIKFRYDGQRIILDGNFKDSGRHTLTLKYSCEPKQTVYFIGVDDEVVGNEQIWTQGQGKYTSHWLPSFDDMNEKVEFDLKIQKDKSYTLIANGELIDFTKGPISNPLYSYNMEKPMSSYLLAFAIGKFAKTEIRSSSGIPIELYYEYRDSLKVEPTYRYTKQIFDFLEEEIGVAYPWQNYKQVPVQDFLYAGMENTGCTIFSNAYMIDSLAFVDKNYVNINAHEMAHQWFGNMVTERSGKHHWLHEGFATYYAYLAEKRLFGEDHFYWRLFETAKTLHNLSENGDGEALTNPNANSLTFYEKGAWALAMLKDRVGEEVFRRGIKNYLTRFAYKNVTIDDFLEEMEQAAQTNLYDFREKWLEGEEFPWEEVKTFLMKKSHSTRLYHVYKHDADYGVENRDWLNDTLSLELRLQLLSDFKKRIPKLSYQRILRDPNLLIRQKGIQQLDELPAFLREDAEGLLNDDSYLTKEYALYNLWASFPENRNDYLNQTKNLVGLPNKNIRLLWLTLALVTPEYLPEKKEGLYDELNAYTNSENHFEVRQLAFQYLNEIKALNDQSLRNLIEASTHHVWQFKKSARNLLRDFVKVEGNRQRLKLLEKSMSNQQKEALNNVLNP